MSNRLLAGLLSNVKTLHVLIVALILLCAGCGPKAPDKSLILWEQPAPGIAANTHASEKPGLRAFHVLPTGSMEPFLTGGDWIVVDSNVPFASIKAGDLLLYQANWLPADSPPVTHMAAARSGPGWAMDGIANRHYENGAQTMMPADYRGKVIQVYTKRKKT